MMDGWINLGMPRSKVRLKMVSAQSIRMNGRVLSRIIRRLVV